MCVCVCVVCGGGNSACDDVDGGATKWTLGNTVRSHDRQKVHKYDNNNDFTLSSITSCCYSWGLSAFLLLLLLLLVNRVTVGSMAAVLVDEKRRLDRISYFVCATVPGLERMNWVVPRMGLIFNKSHLLCLA